MNLVSCEYCGVVVDIDRLDFPDINEGTDSLVDDKAAWDGEKYVSSLPCPVCKTDKAIMNK